MADELTVTGSEPLPDLHVVNSAPLPAAKAPGWFEQVVHSTANALSNFGHDMNPVNIAAGMGAFVDPATAKNAWLNLGASQDEMRVKAANSFAKGDYLTGVRQTVAWLWPVMGPQMESIAEQGAKGDYSGAIGRTAAFGAQTYLGSKAPAILEAAPEVISAAGPVIKGGVKGGYQAFRDTAHAAGSAELITEHLGLPPGTGAAIVGAPRIVRGIIQGARAGTPEGLRLEGISQTLAGKSYADLTPAEQTAVRTFRNADHATAVNEFAQGLAGKDFLNLPPEQQAAVRTMYQKSQAYQAAQAAPQGPVGPMPEFGEATTPAGKSLTQMIDEELAAKRAAQTQRLVGIEHTPVWQNLPEAPVPLGVMVEGPLPRPALPTRPPQPAPATPAAAPTETPAAPAPGSSLSDLVEAMRGIAKRKAEGAPLSEVGRTPSEPAPSPAPVPAPSPAPQPTPMPEFQTPALEGLTATEPGAAVNVYKQRAQVLKAQRFANTLEAEGLPFEKTRTWSPDEWKAHAEKVGENAPSQDTVNQILAEQQIRESKQAFESARAEGLSKTQRFLAAITERNITHAESLKWGPGEWNQLAAELGENKPTLKEIQNIRAKLKYQESLQP